MVYINQTQLKELELLLTQSVKGIHLLFDNSSVAEILKNPTENMDFFTLENVNRIQGLLSSFIQQKSLDEKRSYLKSLDKESYELLVRSYFNIVENTIFEESKLRH